MSILDVTEEQIFHTLGKGRDPNFKPIEKARPAVVKPKKTYALNQPIKVAKPVMPAKAEVLVKAVEAPPVFSEEVDDSVKKLTAEMNELNNRVSGIQSMVKWYIVPQFIVVLALIFMLFMKS